MRFYCNKLQISLLTMGLLPIGLLSAAEWKIEPHVGLNVQYNDNVRLFSSSEGSIGSTFSPSVRIKAEERSLWDMYLDARGKLTRFKSVEDADSNNVFFVFDASRSTERFNWRLNTLFEKKSNFDTDFDTTLVSDGFTSDRTDRTTVTIGPSVTWQMSEMSQINVGLNVTDVSYDEVTSVNFKDYEYNSLNVSGSWAIAQNHRLGFTNSYAEYDSSQGGANLPFSFEQIVLQLDYTYTVNAHSNLEITNNNAQVNISNEDRGAVANLSFTHQSERLSHNILVDRTVIPSSFGSAQEKNSVTYRLNFKNNERLSTNLIINTSETTTLQGGNSSIDRTLNRIQSSLSYRINRNWSASVQYRYLSQTLTNTNEDRSSNAVFVSFSLNWPKFATTY